LAAKKFSSPSPYRTKHAPSGSDRLRAPSQQKSLSQVFLRSEEPLKKVSAELLSLGIRRVLEIGPGGGVLTKELVKSGFQVTAIEKDSRFAEHLAQEFRHIEAPKGASLQLVNQDFLKYPVEEWLAAEPSPNGIVGNIPYHISSAIIQKIVELQRTNLRAVILMTQKEFAQRLVAEPGSKDYGSLSVFIQLRMKIRILDIIPRHLFSPVPKVDSALFIAEPLESLLPPHELELVEKVARMAFSQRRKKLINSLASFQALKSLDHATAPVDLNLRADALSPMEFHKLALWIGDSRGKSIEGHS
jgi:16S rRNA (adenine1518-N6/adenine1519-N6)-dimethyltransferase